MGMTDQVIRETPLPVESQLDEIALIVERARDGSVTEAEALEAIRRIAGGGTADEIYQKPWG